VRELNLTNVEEVIFYDTEIQKVFPAHYFSLFEQWRISKRIPAMKSLGKQALMDFLNTITDEEVVRLEEYLGERIRVERLNYSLTTNLKLPLADQGACGALCQLQDFGNLTVWRDDQFLYVTFWR
jgi:hypothetical protein